MAILKERILNRVRVLYHVSVISNKFSPLVPLIIGAAVAFAGPAPWSDFRNALFYSALALSGVWAGYQAIWLRDHKTSGAAFFWACGGFTVFALNSLLNILIHK